MDVKRMDFFWFSDLSQFHTLEDVVETPRLVFRWEQSIFIQRLESTTCDGSFVTLDEVLGLVGVLSYVQVPKTSIGIMWSEDSIEFILTRNKLTDTHATSASLFLHVEWFNSLDNALLILIKENNSWISPTSDDILTVLVDIKSIDARVLSFMQRELTKFSIRSNNLFFWIRFIESFLSVFVSFDFGELVLECSHLGN